MSRTAPVGKDDMQRAVAEACTHANGSRLAALAYDVLSTQADGGSLFAGKKFMAGKAEAHGVTRESAGTALGNLQTILETGPQHNPEWALVAAFAIRGFGERLAEAGRDEKAELVDAFVARLDWLEVCSHYRVYPMVESLLDRFAADAVYRAVGNAVLRDDRGEVDGEMRARNAARLTALVEAGTEGAREALAHVVAAASDPFTAAIVAGAVGDAVRERSAPAPAQADTPRLQGTAVRPRSRSIGRTIAVLTGVALLAWLLTAVMWMVRMRREVRLELGRSSLRVLRRTAWLDREYSVREQTVHLDQVVSVRRHARYPALHALVGLSAFALGLFVGGLFLFDGVRVGAVPLIALGGGILLGGALLDLVLGVLVPAGRGRVMVDVGLRGGERIGLGDVPADEADRFVQTLAGRIDARVA